MKKPNQWFLFLTLIGFVATVTGAAVYAQDNQMRKDDEERLADLHKAKSVLDAAKADLGVAQQNLAAVQQRPHTDSETQALQARVDKDQSTIQSCITQVVGDANFLETRWSVLTQEEKDFVSSVQKNLD
ncbi:MAG TPA: hypothetical protein VJ873_09505 [bacterium]|nr:hypothetical protein [bacterium]